MIIAKVRPRHPASAAAAPVTPTARAVQGQSPSAPPPAVRIPTPNDQVAHAMVPNAGAPNAGAPNAGAPATRTRPAAQLSRSTRHILLRELGEMIVQGVPLAQALSSLESAFRRGERARATRAIGQALIGGGSLADALQSAGFDLVEVALVRAAERSGPLGAALGRLASRLEIEQSVAAEIRAGLLQPLGMVLSAAVLLPAPLAIESGFRAWFAAAAAGVAGVAFVASGLVWGLPRLWTRPALRGRILGLAEAIPGLSALVRRRRFALLFGVLAPALEAGVPLDEALLLSADAVAEPRVADAIAGLAVRVRTIGGLAEGARSLPGMDEETLGRLATGELGGGLAAVATERAATFTRRHTEALRGGAKALRTVLSALVMIAVSAAIAAQFGKMLGDPMSMMPSSERNDLERELNRAMPQLQGGLGIPGLDDAGMDKSRRKKAQRNR